MTAQTYLSSKKSEHKLKMILISFLKDQSLSMMLLIPLCSYPHNTFCLFRDAYSIIKLHEEDITDVADGNYKVVTPDLSGNRFL